VCTGRSSGSSYAFVLHYTLEQLVIGTLIGLGIAILAIEGAFAQMFKFRKRSSYPSVVVLECGNAKTVPEAGELALEATVDLLGANGAWLALNGEGGEIELSAAHNVEPLTAQRYIQLRSQELLGVLAGQNPRIRLAGTRGAGPIPDSGADHRLATLHRRARPGVRAFHERPARP
jgi:hypothetical protein